MDGIQAIMIICCFLGVYAEYKRKKAFDKGIIKGVPQSKNIVDYLFFNYE